MSTIQEIGDAFHLLYESILDRDFRKTLGMEHWTERDMLPSIRTFLLGWFGTVAPEVRTKLPGKEYGLIDFCVGGVAVEFALRRPYDKKANVSDRVNTDEIKKLLLYEGRAVLVLFDFSKSPLTLDELKRFRERPSLGPGRRNKSAFHVSYHSRGDKRAHQPSHHIMRIMPQ